ncbi:hypothetical protein, partial [Niallia circulans]|uniref:hypothetical protein n=2 Tax=Niallia TaxID=2837506 RepID=UPI00300B3318
ISQSEEEISQSEWEISQSRRRISQTTSSQQALPTTKKLQNKGAALQRATPLFDCQSFDSIS